VALRLTISFKYGDGSVCGEVVGVNMGHVLLADQSLTRVKCEPCEVVAEYGAAVVGGRICGGRAELILIANAYQISRILRELHYRGLQPRVIGRAKYIRDPQLTEDQLKLVELAYRLGYFDDGRKISLKELAAVAGISPSAADRKLRRALRKIVEFYLSRFGRGDLGG